MIIKSPCIIDISHWEVPDWPNLDSRVMGVIMKATQGKFYRDPTCRANYIGAGARGVPRGLYHYAEPDDVAAQVNNFLVVCEEIGALRDGVWLAELPPILDAEYYPNTETSVVGAQLAAQYEAWMTRVEQAVGVRPWIYSSNNFLGFTQSPIFWTAWKDKYSKTQHDWMTNSSSMPPAWAGTYPLWIAEYPHNPDEQEAPNSMPSGWPDFILWQYAESAKGEIAGIAESVDLNVFNGSEDEWIYLFGGGVIPPDNPPGETMIAYNPNPLNLRTAPHVATDTLIMSMPANTRIEGTEIVAAMDGGKWLKTTVPQAGYCASWLLEYETDPAIDTATITVEHDGKAGAATIPLE